MIKQKIRIITEVEIEYEPGLVSIDNIVSELDYSFTVSEMHADLAKITDTEIQEWQ